MKIQDTKNKIQTRACPAKPCCALPKPCAKGWRSRGASLIDALVGSAIFLVVAMGFLGVLQLSIKEATDSKARAGALALANEQIEFLHSLTYADVGVGDKNRGHGNDDDGVDDENPGGGGGVDQGLLLNRITHITLNGIEYERRTYVRYVDDPNDGLANQDDDHNRDDYKKVKVEVVWESRGVAHSVSLVTNITPDF